MILTFIRKKWHLILIGALFGLQILVFCIAGENSYIAVHDNLELFVSHNGLIKAGDFFFKHNIEVPMLGGISRDLLGSQLTLANFLYFLFTPFMAYIINYFLKIIIGFIAFNLLIKELFPDIYSKYKEISYICGFAFGLVPVFPLYGTAFTSIPLVIILLNRIYKNAKPIHYILLFVYPMVSYFSYFGFFILAYISIYFLYEWIKSKKFKVKALLAIVVLSVGYVVFEYRLFYNMLAVSDITIRDTIKFGDYSLIEVFKSIISIFIDSMFHAQSSHKYIVLPVVLAMMILLNIARVKHKDSVNIKLIKGCNLLFSLICFNCVIYGFYYYKPLRDLFEAIVPLLKGFQFNRTIFLNPLLWMLLFFLIVINICESKKIWMKLLAYLFVVLNLLVVMFYPQTYNDFYYTCKNCAYEIITGNKPSQLSFNEFFSEKLFQNIKEEINYSGDFSVAYGLSSGVLQYNGIATLDGYLGMYSQEYKDDFRKIIKPALDKCEANKKYYDEWGAKAYLFAEDEKNCSQPYRNIDFTTNNLYIDTSAMKNLGGKYIFSRINISNSEELNIELIDVFVEESTPYEIYLYQIK